MNTKNTLETEQLIVGLTGGIGSGKTVVSDWFALQGVDIIDADVIAHQVVAVGSDTLQTIADELGTWVLDATGALDRTALRAYVFANPDALETLEKITHPAIRQQIVNQLESSKSVYSILSAPLLLEGGAAGLSSLCDCIMVVDVAESTQLARASSRDGQSAEQIQAVMKKQLSRAERNQSADILISNEGTLEQLYDSLPEIHRKLLVQADAKQQDI